MRVPLTPRRRRHLLIALLGSVATVTTLLLGTQLFVILFAVKGRWQVPTIAQVEFIRADTDPIYPASDKVYVFQHGMQKELVMMRSDYDDLKKGDSFFILHNFFVTPLRPAQFRLSLTRLLVEYPEPIWLFCLYYLWRIFRSRLGIAEDQDEEAPTGPVRVITDDFHRRAEKRQADE